MHIVRVLIHYLVMKVLGGRDVSNSHKKCSCQDSGFLGLALKVYAFGTPLHIQRRVGSVSVLFFSAFSSKNLLNICCLFSFLLALSLSHLAFKTDD